MDELYNPTLSTEAKLVLLMERQRIYDRRADSVDLRLIEVEKAVLKLTSVEASLLSIQDNQHGLNEGIASLTLQLSAQGARVEANEERNRLERERGQRKRHNTEARNSKISNLILGVMASLLTAVLVSGLVYINTTYHSLEVDAVAVLIIVLIGGLVISIYRKEPEEEI